MSYKGYTDEGYFLGDVSHRFKQVKKSLLMLLVKVFIGFLRLLSFLFRNSFDITSIPLQIMFYGFLSSEYVQASQSKAQTILCRLC